jgi:hypothetical protein
MRANVSVYKNCSFLYRPESFYEGEWAMDQYNIVFEGTISDGYGAEEVKRNLAALFKVDQKSVERLFAKQPVVLKKDMDYDSAMKYQRALQKAGAICKIQAAILDKSALFVEEAAPVQNTYQLVEQAVPAALPKQTPHSVIEGVVNSNPELITEKPAEDKTSKGLGDIIAGVVLIGIGFVLGGSIFLGNADTLDIIFDCIGLFLIGKGLYRMLR